MTGEASIPPIGVLGDREDALVVRWGEVLEGANGDFDLLRLIMSRLNARGNCSPLKFLFLPYSFPASIFNFPDTSL